MSIGLYNSLIVLATLVGMYLFTATLFMIVLCVGVARDMWKKFSELTRLQWMALPFLFLYYGFVHGLQWPRYWWEDHKRTQVTRRYIRDTARRLGVT